MKVYHGSLDAVINPVIKEPTRTLDYGSGFYVTTSVKQAERWVLRKLDASHPVGWVNVYEWDERKTDGLQIQNFGVPDEKWLDFVMSNRTDMNYMHNYDIVWGPVADDRVYAAFALYEQGFLDKRALINELRAYKLVDQILFHTEKSLKTLKYIDKIEVQYDTTNNKR
jgi:hypothetical protein